VAKAPVRRKRQPASSESESEGASEEENSVDGDDSVVADSDDEPVAVKKGAKGRTTKVVDKVPPKSAGRAVKGGIKGKKGAGRVMVPLEEESEDEEEDDEEDEEQVDDDDEVEEGDSLMDD
jgi:hypothetical protein